MRWHAVLSLFFFLSPSVVLGQGRYALKYAKKLHLQIQETLPSLTAAPDSAAYYETVMRLLTLGVACDSVELLSRKGEKAVFRYRDTHYAQLNPLRLRLRHAALGQLVLRPSYLDFYVEVSHTSLFHDTSSPGPLFYEAAEAAFHEGHDFPLAEHYADKALAFEDVAEQAAQLKIRCMRNRLSTPVDSSRYVIALLELHDKSPANPQYFQMLVEYFSMPGRTQDMARFAQDEVRKSPTNVQAWLLRGETCMQRKDWKEAVVSFERAVALDSLLVEAYYNAGLSQVALALELRDSLPQGRLSGKDSQLLRARFTEARRSLEKARSLDPERKKVDWAMPLYQVYFMLREKRKAAEMQALGGR